MVAELAHLVLVAHRDQPDPRATQVLPDLRAMLVNADQKALGGLQGPPGPAGGGAGGTPVPGPEGPRGSCWPSWAKGGAGHSGVLLGLRAITAFLVPPDPLVPPEQMVNLA